MSDYYGAHEILVRLMSEETSRDKQRLVGASNLSNPCTRCLARDMAAMLPHGKDIEPAPRGKYFLGAVVGTFVHAGLEDRASKDPNLVPETKVTLGTIKGYGTIRSTSDLYVKPAQRVMDWKGLALDTPLPTPTGWTTMGEVQVGEEVLGADGLPTKVTGKSEVKHVRTFVLAFKDGQRVVADEDHLWTVDVGRMGRYKTQVVNTLDLIGLLETKTIRIRNSLAVQGEDIALPIDPYVFGVWLGDGSNDSGAVHNPDNRIFDAVRDCGYVVGDAFDIADAAACQSRTIYGLRPVLRDMGVLRNKHVPTQYLRASKSQRLALLQGLMDTDGYLNKARGGRVSMQTTSRWQAEAVYDLASSLGWTCQFSPVKVTWQGGTKGGYNVEFSPQEPVFRARTENTGTRNSERATLRYVVSAEEVFNTPTQCISVDAEDSLYLCTRGYIPTHNTSTKEKLEYYKRVVETPPNEYSVTKELEAEYTIRRYLTQLYLYGLGIENAGFPVKSVAIGFIPRDAKKVDDLWTYEVPYDRGVAERAMLRAEKIWEALTAGKRWDTFKSQGHLCYQCSNR